MVSSGFRSVASLVLTGILTGCLAACTSTTTESTPHSAESSEPSPEGSAPTQAAGGPVELGPVTNARHTGGLTTSTGLAVRANVLIRSGQITDPAACPQLEALGVRTVVDLRAASAVQAEPDAACVVSGTNYYNADVPKLLPPGAEVYLQTLDALEPKLAEIFTRLSGNDALPAIIHCVIGRDRASLTMALVLMSLGVPREQVLADFENNQDVDVDRAWMNGVLARIDQAGGIETYLSQHGVTEERLRALRTMALQ